MAYKVGDRVRCVSKDDNAPVGIVGTVTQVLDPQVAYFTGFQYMVKYDPGQNEKVDLHFGSLGTPENDEDIELVTEDTDAHT